MGSFRGHSWKEGGEGASRFPVWERKARTAILDLPGADNDVVQTFGRKSRTLAMLVTVTAAELAALDGDVGRTGTLVFHYETCSAYLDSITGPHEILAMDKYTVTLNLIRQ